MIYDLSCVTLMRAFLRLSLYVEVLIIGNTRLSIKNLESPLTIGLLALSRLLAAHVNVVLLLILIMDVLNN
jgi:hypothetical protein